VSSVAGRTKFTVAMCQRALRLRERGLSYPSIAAVLELDYEVPVLPTQVHYHLRRLGCPAKPHGRPFRGRHR
jgi:hypothetical protein